MDKLRKFIRKEIQLLKEATVKRPLPNDAKQVLFKTLNLQKKHINGVQAIKSITPAYRIYLNNNQSFVLKDIGNNFGFGLVKINDKEYDILDLKQIPLALDALEDLQTKPIIKTTGDEETGGAGGEGGIEDTTPEEPAEEPAEEPEA